MPEAGQDVLEVLLHGFRAARQVDDERLAAQYTGGAAQHPAGGDGKTVVPHGLGDAGGVAVGHGIGGLGGNIPGREAGAAGGQDKVHLTAIGQTDELCFQRPGLVGQEHRLFHHIACGGEHLHDERAALVLPLAPAALVRKGDDRSAQRRIFRRGQKGHFVADTNLAALQHPGKYALSGHDALAGLLLDDAVVVALLADLGHLQHHVADGEAAGDGQAAEVEALDDEVFAEGAVVHPDLLAERLDLLGAEQAHLPVPVSAVGVAHDAPFRGQDSAWHLGLDGAALGAGADRQNFSHSNLSSDTVHPAGGGHGIVSEMMFPGFRPDGLPDGL